MRPIFERIVGAENNTSSSYNRNTPERISTPASRPLPDEATVWQFVAIGKPNIAMTLPELKESTIRNTAIKYATKLMENMFVGQNNKDVCVVAYARVGLAIWREQFHIGYNHELNRIEVVPYTIPGVFKEAIKMLRVY